tara:strand:+ start:18317 stop:19330 length:1014 start_codon:yes stop_codon:yes gene_type:complete
MDSNSQLGVGVSGLGVGERHARTINETEGASLIKIYDPNIEKASALSIELNTKACKSFNDLILDERIDVIVVASPDHFHVKQIVEALKRGKHVFAEKPLCNTFDELKAISNEWFKQSDKLKLYSNLILREAPIYKWLKKSIDEGLFGEIYSVDGDYLYGRKEKILKGWRGTGENYSGMKGGGIHMIDLMCWLTDQRPLSLSTLGNNICTRHSNINISDFMSTTFKFESGMVGRINANLGCVHRHQHVLRIFGTKATFIFDDKGPRIHFSSSPSHEATEVELESLPSGKSDIVPIFLNAVKNNIDLKNKTKETFDIVSIVIGCDEALLSGKEEEIIYL